MSMSNSSGCASVYLGEELFTESSIADIAAREGKRGLGIYVTQENRILDKRHEIVLRRRQTIVLLAEAKFCRPDGKGQVNPWRVFSN